MNKISCSKHRYTPVTHSYNKLINIGAKDRKNEQSSDSIAPGRSDLSYPSIYPSDVSSSRSSSRHSLLGTSNGPVKFFSFKSNNEKPLRLLLLSILLLLYISQRQCNLCGYKRTVWRLLMTSGMVIIVIYLPAVYIQGRVKL